MALEIPPCDRLTNARTDDWVDALWRDVSERGCTGDDLQGYADRRKRIKTAFNDVRVHLDDVLSVVETDQDALGSLKADGQAGRTAGAASLPNPINSPVLPVRGRYMKTMNRQEIISEVHKRIGFFREKWAEFCRKVEGYASELDRLELVARTQYAAEWDDVNLRKWREDQAAPWKKLLRWAEKTRDHALQKYRQAEEEYKQAVRRTYPGWIDKYPPDLFEGQQLPAPLSEFRDQLAPYYLKVDKLRRAYRIKYHRADHRLPRCADPNSYSPQEQAKAKDPGPEYTWTMPTLELWLTAYLQLPPDRRRHPKIPEEWFVLTCFYRPLSLMNPTIWFDLVAHCPTVAPLSEPDQLLHDVVILCVAHDYSPAIDRGSKRTIPTEYDGKYFMRDAFTRDLSKALQNDDTRIELAWQGTEPLVMSAGKPPQREMFKPANGLNEPLTIPGLVERLKTLRSTLDSGERESISRARNDLRQYVGSAERLYGALQEPLRGSTADTIERLKWVGDARKSRMNTGLYAALLDGLATPEFIAELERWQTSVTKSQPSLPQTPPGDTPQEKIQPADCTHSDDFSSLLWYGTSHHFTATQALCVALLWAEWEKDPQAGLGLREKFIGEKIGSSNENYRLAHTFRQKGKQHPAWGAMIHAKGDGFFYQAEPAAVKKSTKKHKK